MAHHRIDEVSEDSSFVSHDQRGKSDKKLKDMLNVQNEQLEQVNEEDVEYSRVSPESFLQNAMA